MTLRAVPPSKLPTEAEARAHAGLVAGEIERLHRLDEALSRAFDMREAAIKAALAAQQETIDMRLWIRDRITEQPSVPSHQGRPWPVPVSGSPETANSPPTPPLPSSATSLEPSES